ncbi:hypothetical protein [Saccharibacillus sacchari]|uniref:Uncharacterized protein n=1 Tax=Saccharibacillus sacchari TaxID=456493 RepID=A0ACC6P707_9BACL
MTMNKRLNPYDFSLQSEDPKSVILFSFKEVELERYKSINYLVHIKDDLFTGHIEIWIAYEDFKLFVEGLLKTRNKESNRIRLQAMSEDEFEMTLIERRSENYEVAYSITKRRYSKNRLIETTLKGSFDYDSEFLNALKQNVKDICRLLH